MTLGVAAPALVIVRVGAVPRPDGRLLLIAIAGLGLPPGRRLDDLAGSRGHRRARDGRRAVAIVVGVGARRSSSSPSWFARAAAPPAPATAGAVLARSGDAAGVLRAAPRRGRRAATEYRGTHCTTTRGLRS